MSVPTLFRAIRKGADFVSWLPQRPSRSAGLISILLHSRARPIARLLPGSSPAPVIKAIGIWKNTAVSFLPSQFFAELRPGARNEPNRPFPGRSRRQPGTEHNPHKHRYLDLCRVLIMGHWFCRLHNRPFLSQSESVSCFWPPLTRFICGFSAALR
jgi:hypothetical protein